MWKLLILRAPTPYLTDPDLTACPAHPTADPKSQQWADAFLGYFRTGGANNGGTEAVNGLIELHRRIARGFRNRENYRLRMLLVAGGLDQPPPQV